VLAPPETVPGWDQTRALALLEPALERMCQRWLGPAADWTFAFRTQAGEEVRSLADLGISAVEAVLGAVDHVAESTPDDGSSVADGITASPLLLGLYRSIGPSVIGLADGASGIGRFGELTALAGRWRHKLAGASPLLLSNLAPNSGEGWDRTDLEGAASRVQAWSVAVGEQASALTDARKALSGAADDAGRDAAFTSIVAALDALTATGIRSARCGGSPIDDVGRNALAAQADAVLEILGTVLAHPIPAVPGPGADKAAAVRAWFGAATDIVRAGVGDAMILLPEIDLGDGAGAVKASGRPTGSDDDAVLDWLRELTPVRPSMAEYREALLASEVLAGAPAATFVVTQLPAGTAPSPWIAVGPSGDGGKGSPRKTCILRGTEPGGTSVSGLVFDAWTEAIPTPPKEGRSPEEIAAIAFHIDRPDARAPQAALLAVPPDIERGWREEDLHAVITDCLELATLRSLDLTDLPELRALVPVM
jgi:hypothetical protein